MDCGLWTVDCGPRLVCCSDTKLEVVDYDDVEMGEMIGGGGFALVYRCKYKRKTLACKLIFDPNVSEENKKEFFDELNTMKKLWHPNIVSLTGYGDRPSKMFFLMDLCEGSVFDLLHKTRIKLKERQLAKMCLEIAQGMEYLHAVDPPIIHRDLKTENVLLAVRTDTPKSNRTKNKTKTRKIMFLQAVVAATMPMPIPMPMSSAHDHKCHTNIMWIHGTCRSCVHSSPKLLCSIGPNLCCGMLPLLLLFCFIYFCRRMAQ